MAMTYMYSFIHLPKSSKKKVSLPSRVVGVGRTHHRQNYTKRKVQNLRTGIGETEPQQQKSLREKIKPKRHLTSNRISKLRTKRMPRGSCSSRGPGECTGKQRERLQSDGDGDDGCPLDMLTMVDRKPRPPVMPTV